MDYKKYKRFYELYYQYDYEGNRWLKVELPIAMDFTIQRNNLASTNTCNITLYNLSKKSRDLFYRDQLDVGKPYDTTEIGFIKASSKDDQVSKSVNELRNYIEIYAGYESTKVKYLVFSGMVLSCYSYKDGVDYKTEISGYSANLKDPSTYFSMSVPAGTTKGEVIRILATQMAGIYKYNVDPTYASEVIETDTILMGTVEDILASQLGYKPYVDNSSLIVMADDSVLKGEPFILDSSCGLLGSPRRTQNGVKVSMVFEPSVRIGQHVKLKAHMEQTYNDAHFVISGFRHSGSISSVSDTQTTTELELYKGAGYFRTNKGQYKEAIENSIRNNKPVMNVIKEIPTIKSYIGVDSGSIPNTYV